MARRNKKVDLNLIEWIKYVIQLRQLRADIAIDEQDYARKSTPPS